MKSRTTVAITHLLTAVILLLSLSVASGCMKPKPDFGIFMADTGTLVLSEQHIKTYYRDTHCLELNEKGIQQWNSFQTYPGIPKLADTVYGKEFIVKIHGKEMYRGKFYSNLSSATYSGVVILDSLMKLDSNNNTIRIDFGYPSTSFSSGTDPRNNPQVLDFFAKRGMLK
jgi:hypothetical protein